VTFVELLGLVDVFFLFMNVWCLSLVYRTLSGYESTDPLVA
jgi:hypothetical protein